VAGQLINENSIMGTRPFRAPHHTISDSALVGGGKNPKPGEISLAHNGILFLDELPEFKRNVLESLRQPIEEAKITVSRVSSSCTYPAKFMLIAAMNPCPCGYFTDPKKACHCSPTQIQRYRSAEKQIQERKTSDQFSAQIQKGEAILQSGRQRQRAFKIRHSGAGPQRKGL
jgi:magnesium chelatase family protein